MSRGRPKEILIEPKPLKFDRKFEDEDCIEVWKYDLKKFNKGPISIEITYKTDVVKKWGSRLKTAKADKKASQQMKKINERQTIKKTTGKRGRPKKSN